MNRTNVLLKIAVLRELLAASIAGKSLLSIVNSANVYIEVITLTEQFVACGAFESIDFVWIVHSIDVVEQTACIVESLQTM